MSTLPLVTLHRHVEHTPALQAYGASRPAANAASKMDVCASDLSEWDAPSKVMETDVAAPVSAAFAGFL